MSSSSSSSSSPSDVEEAYTHTFAVASATFLAFFFLTECVHNYHAALRTARGATATKAKAKAKASADGPQALAHPAWTVWARYVVLALLLSACMYYLVREFAHYSNRGVSVLLAVAFGAAYCGLLRFRTSDRFDSAALGVAYSLVFAFYTFANTTHHWGGGPWALVVSTLALAATLCSAVVRAEFPVLDHFYAHNESIAWVAPVVLSAVALRDDAPATALVVPEADVWGVLGWVVYAWVVYLLFTMMAPHYAARGVHLYSEREARRAKAME